METEGTDLIEENGRVVGVRAHNARRRAGNSRGSGRRYRRASFDDARQGRFRSHESRRSDGRAVVANLARAERSGTNVGPRRRGPLPDHARSRRLLAVCVCHPQGRLRGNSEARTRCSSAHDLATLAPYLRDRVGEIDDWNKISLLSVAVDRLRRWFCARTCCVSAIPRMRCRRSEEWESTSRFRMRSRPRIFSPRACARGRLGVDALREVQTRREFPTRMTQGLQIFMQNRFISRVLESNQRLPLPLA